MAYEALKFQQDGPVAFITLNRPERLNALSARMVEEFNSVIDDLEGDATTRVVIINGAGRVFCAGDDLKERVEQGQAGRIIFNRIPVARLFDRIESLSQITIAAVHGHALGGGCELALACDLRVAAADAMLGQPEVKLGLLPAAGGSQRLPRLIGIGRAKELLYLGDSIDASTALQWGLLHRVVPREALLEEARRLASVLLERPPVALRIIKGAVQAGMQMDLPSALEYEARCYNILNATEDYKEGIQAFVEKRAPVFQGR